MFYVKPTVFLWLGSKLNDFVESLFEKESAEDPLESQAETRHLQSWRCLPCLENFSEFLVSVRGMIPDLSVVPPFTGLGSNENRCPLEAKGLRWVCIKFTSGNLSLKPGGSSPFLEDARGRVCLPASLFISLRLMPPAFAGLEIASSMARSTTKSSSNNSTILSIASSMARSTTKSNSNSSNNQQQQ